jgi:uncharacterized protein (DUF1330 family)
MSSYLVGVVDKKDLKTYELYATGGYEAIQPFEVAVTIAEQPEVLEGKFPGTTLIIMKFKNHGDAQKFYNSPAYQKVIPYRHASAGTPFTVAFDSDD